VAAASADARGSLFLPNPQSAIPNPKFSEGWQPLRLTRVVLACLNAAGVQIFHIFDIQQTREDGKSAGCKNGRFRV
jgi:hypothetical protein